MLAGVRLQADRPAVGLRVAGVQGQVEDDQLELRPVGQDGGGPVAPRMRELEAAVEQRVDHRRDAREEVVEVEDRRLEGLVPAEREELAEDPRRVAAGLLDRRHLGLHGRTDAVLGERRVGADDEDEVPEVVGDAASEPPHDLHLGRAGEPFLELRPGADVGREEQPAARVEPVPGERRGVERRRDRRLVLAAAVELVAVQRSVGHDALEEMPDALARGRHGEALTRHLVPRPAEEPLGAGRPAVDLSAGVELHDRERRRLEDGLEPIDHRDEPRLQERHGRRGDDERTARDQEPDGTG